MQEMEEEYSRDEQANNAIKSRAVFVTIGTTMDEDKPGRAPPIALEKGKGPLIAANDDRAKVMPPPPNPVQQPQELGTGPSNNNTANLPPSASTSAAAQVTPADRVMYGNLLVEPLTVAHIRNVTQLDEKRQQLLEMAQVFHLPLARRVKAIWLPAILPAFRQGCSVALGICWKSGVAAEVIGLPNGSIGDALYRAKITLSTGELFAWTFVIILLSAGFEKLFLLALDKAVGAVLGEERTKC